MERDAPSLAWRAALGAVFFVSGAASLVYEVVWARMLAVYLGNTMEAHTVVVAVFMGGLGVGYVVGGRIADRVGRPLKAYAITEVGISLWALLFQPVLQALSGVPSAPLLAALTLLPPTLLMGATLPLLTRGLVDRGLDLSRSLSGLYAVNSAGAVFGTLLSGLVLVEWLGVSGTLYAAVAANLLLPGAVLWLARRSPRHQTTSAPTAEASTALAAAPTWLAPAVAGVLGLVALGLQGVWLRYFGMVLGSSAYAFTLVIAVFIAGVALGSALARRFVSRWRSGPETAAFVLAAALFRSLRALVPLFERFPYDLVVLRHRAADSAGTGAAGFALYGLYRLGLVAALVLIPTALSGALLPIVATVGSARVPRRDLAAYAGRIFAANTAGAVIGVIITVPVLVGALGLGETYRLMGWLVLAVALALAAYATLRLQVRIGALVLGLVATLVVPAAWNPRLLSAGTFRWDRAPADIAAFEKTARRGDLVFHDDGPHATVTVVERVHDGKAHRTLTVNGKPDASTRGDMLTQVGSAHLPLMLHPKPRRILVIGLGSGVTVGSAALHPVAIDAVEISSAVAAASRHFDGASGTPLTKPNVTLHLDDARGFMHRAGDGRYDVIVSEPSNPWVAGNAGLFGREFFQTVQRSLAPGGLFAQWLQLYETDDATVALVMRTLSDVFGPPAVWELFPNDVLLIARADGGPPPLQIHDWTGRATPPIVADLDRVHLGSPQAMHSLLALTPAEVQRFLADHPQHLNTDDRPRLEFMAPRALFANRRATLLSRLDIRRRAATGLPPREAERLFILHTIYPGAPDGYRLSLIPQLLRRSSPPFLVDVLFTLEREKRYDAAAPVIAKLEKAASTNPRALYAIARTQRAQGQLAAAEATARRCLSLGDDARGRCGRLLLELGGHNR